VTLPGLDEELAFRGIMLGLLVTALSNRLEIGRLNLGHPAMWVTAVLFGFVHGLRFGGALYMDWFHFGMTAVIDLILAWMTLKSRSILMPIVAHNLYNFSLHLTEMLK